MCGAANEYQRELVFERLNEKHGDRDFTDEEVADEIWDLHQVWPSTSHNLCNYVSI